jgi:hypothetical protein
MIIINSPSHTKYIEKEFKNLAGGIYEVGVVEARAKIFINNINSSTPTEKNKHSLAKKCVVEERRVREKNRK